MIASISQFLELAIGIEIINATAQFWQPVSVVLGAAVMLNYASEVAAKRGFSREGVVYVLSKVIGIIITMSLICLILYATQAYTDGEYLTVIEWVCYAFVTLLVLNELNKMGDNVTEINGSKPFIFKIIGSIFKIAESSFIKKLGKLGGKNGNGNGINGGEDVG